MIVLVRRAYRFECGSCPCRMKSCVDVSVLGHCCLSCMIDRKREVAGSNPA